MIIYESNINDDDWVKNVRKRIILKKQNKK